MSKWYKLECTPELNLKPIISEIREAAQIFNDFADNLEQLEKKYTKLQESEGKEKENE
jgi:hypothetical protein